MPHRSETFDAVSADPQATEDLLWVRTTILRAANAFAVAVGVATQAVDETPFFFLQRLRLSLPQVPTEIHDRARVCLLELSWYLEEHGG